VLATTYDGNLVAVDKSGQRVWETSIGITGVPCVSSDGGVVYVAGGSVALAVRASTGVVLWTHTDQHFAVSDASLSPDGSMMVYGGACALGGGVVGCALAMGTDLVLLLAMKSCFHSGGAHVAWRSLWEDGWGGGGGGGRV
jgi:outer membrane protein assembly factor BamB